MQYLNDVAGLIGLKDEAYKKVANDQGALRRLILSFLAMSYISTTLVVLVVAFFGLFIAVAAKFSLALFFVYALLAILFLPLVGLAMDIFFGWLNHIVAVLLGGKARFWDFYKVYHYPKPFVIILALIPFVNMVVQLYAIWDFVILYKSLINVHKLSSSTAGWFIAVKAVLTAIVMICMIVLMFTILAAFAAIMPVATATAAA